MQNNKTFTYDFVSDIVVLLIATKNHTEDGFFLKNFKILFYEKLLLLLTGMNQDLIIFITKLNAKETK